MAKQLFRKWVIYFVAGLFVAVVVVFAMLIVFGTAARPPEMKSVIDPFRGANYSDLPNLQSFRARDGQVLSYRLYEGKGNDVAVLIHGSAGESSGMHLVAKALQAAEETVYVPDLRGHGHDGRVGDIDYIGQLEDDLADFAAVIRARRMHSDILLIGHSAGAGFVLRVAVGPNAKLFNRFVLLSPALHYGAVTYRPQVGGWASPFVGRIIALKILNKIGIRWLNGLPIVAFAIDRRAPVPLDETYSFRMQENFSAPKDALAKLSTLNQMMTVLIGDKDEVFYADRFASLIHHERSNIPVVLVPNINHIGMVTDPRALAAIVTASKAKFP